MNTKAWTTAFAVTSVLLSGAAHATSPTYSWTGAYVGLQGGYSWGEAAQTYDDPSAPPVVTTINPLYPKGWGGGFEAGVNYQYSSGLVIGLEGDVAFSHITDTVPDNLGNALLTPGQTNTTTVDLAGNLRGRLGFAFDRTLLFAAAGVSAAHNKLDLTAGDHHEQATVWGWTAGGGIEQAITDKVSVKLEYLYTQHGNHTWFPNDFFASTGDDSANTVRAGVNLHF